MVPPPPRAQVAYRAGGREAASSRSRGPTSCASSTRGRRASRSTGRACQCFVSKRRTPCTLAQLAPVVEGKPDVSRISEIDLDDLARRFRMQTIVFQTARDEFDQMAPTWTGSREVLLAQLVALVERFLTSDRVTITPELFNQDAAPQAYPAHAQHEPDRPPPVGGHPIREHAGAHAGVRQRAARSAPRGTCCPGTRAAPGPTPSARTSTGASSTARGRRARPSRSTVTRT